MADADELSRAMAAARSTWLWAHEAAPPDAAALAAFLTHERVPEAFVSMPAGGPSTHTRRTVAALREHEIRVTALGGDPGWVHPADAVAWAAQAAASGLFEGIHLDIEPWARDDWAGNERALLAGVADTVRAVAASTRMLIEVDLAPWLADDFAEGFAAIAAAAGRVTLMAYRDRAASILACSATARALLGDAGVPYRIGVETMPVEPAHVTFADDGRAVLERELLAVRAQLSGDRWFAGFAIHDAAHWRSLGP